MCSFFGEFQRISYDFLVWTSRVYNLWVVQSGLERRFARKRGQARRFQEEMRHLFPGRFFHSENVSLGSFVVHMSFHSFFDYNEQVQKRSKDFWTA